MLAKLIILGIIVFVILPLGIGNQVDYKKREFNKYNNNEKSKKNPNSA